MINIQGICAYALDTQDVALRISIGPKQVLKLHKIGLIRGYTITAPGAKRQIVKYSDDEPENYIKRRKRPPRFRPHAQVGSARTQSSQSLTTNTSRLATRTAIRGPQAYAHPLLPVLNSRFGSFEDLVAGIHLAAWVVHEDVKDGLAARYGNPEVEICVVGWSHERARAEGHAIASHALWGEPWQRLEIGRFACAPGVEMSAETDIPAAAVYVINANALSATSTAIAASAGS